MEQKIDIKTAFKDGAKNRWHSDHYVGAEKISYAFGKTTYKLHLSDEVEKIITGVEKKKSEFSKQKGILGKIKYFFRSDLIDYFGAFAVFFFGITEHIDLPHRSKIPEIYYTVMNIAYDINMVVGLYFAVLGIKNLKKTGKRKIGITQLVLGNVMMTSKALVLDIIHIFS